MEFPFYYVLIAFMVQSHGVLLRPLAVVFSKSASPGVIPWSKRAPNQSRLLASSSLWRALHVLCFGQCDADKCNTSRCLKGAYALGLAFLEIWDHNAEKQPRMKNHVERETLLWAIPPAECYHMNESRDNSSRTSQSTHRIVGNFVVVSQ